jgi:peptide/nickel transport system permease protein
VIQGLILFFAMIYILLNLVIDLSYTLLDPRIRL